MSSPPPHTKNPLTIIAIFAAIVEASALASLPFLKDDSQDLYTWFLIGFPPFLTLLFFVTLNFNYKVLYSPSDFSNEQDFLDIAKGQPAPAPAGNANAPPPPLPPPSATPAQPLPVADVPVVRQRRGEEFRALYILDYSHFANEQDLDAMITEILRPKAPAERHLIMLYRLSQLRSPVSVLLGHLLGKAFEHNAECTISAYDLDEAALTTLTRRQGGLPARQTVPPA